MIPTAVIIFAAALVMILVVLIWGSRWGSTAAERAMKMPGDAWLEGGPPTCMVMTRAITINARPEMVWPWLEQTGRGAGWYSIDLLDNSGRVSARHIVSWIPAPRLGDATPIGYLRHIEPGRSLAWWVKGTRFFGATARLVVEMRLAPRGEKTRLITRNSADAAGTLARPALLVFRFMDSIMARRQLLEIRERVKRYGIRNSDPEAPETGKRDQYQLYEVIYASGKGAGVSGKEWASQWRRAAIEDGLLPAEEDSDG